MQLELFKSSWAVSNGFENLYEQLQNLVPLLGRCEKESHVISLGLVPSSIPSPT